MEKRKHNTVRVWPKDKRPQMHIKIDGPGVNPVDIDGATTIVAMVDTDEELTVYFRGGLVPRHSQVTQTLLDWIWNLAYHLTVIKRQLDDRGQEEVTMDDVEHTILSALMLPEIKEISDEKDED